MSYTVSKTYPIDEHPLAQEVTENFHVPYHHNSDLTGKLTRVGNVVIASGVCQLWQGNHSFDKVNEEIPIGFRPYDVATISMTSTNAFLIVGSDGKMMIQGNVGQPTDQYTCINGMWLTTDFMDYSVYDFDDPKGHDVKRYYEAYEYSTNIVKVHFPYGQSTNTISFVRIGDFVYAGGWGYCNAPDNHWHKVQEILPVGYRPARDSMGGININGMRNWLWINTDGSFLADGVGGNDWYHATGLWKTNDRMPG